VQYKNTNSGRQNLLNVKSHIKKIGFELVLDDDDHDDDDHDDDVSFQSIDCTNQIQSNMQLKYPHKNKTKKLAIQRVLID